MFKVTIENKNFSASHNENLRELLIKNGFYLNSPCGGNGTCGKCIVKVNGENVKSCDYAISSDISVVVPERDEIISNTWLPESTDALENNDECILCLDIGTSTLALAKVSATDGKIIKAITKTNPQRTFGADVISRIDFCNKNSVKPLKDILISCINEMLVELGVEKKHPLFVSGNTCMLHFFFGEDASSLGAYPYTPVFLDSKSISGNTLGLKSVSLVKSLPCISSFVGADLVAGLNAIDIPKDDKFNLLIDLGTNAEILFFSRDRLISTSAAAGPCFEGGNISCGMSASDGAIYSFSVDENGNKNHKVIGNSSPKGICGTAIFDIVAYLLKEGFIDKTGYMPTEGLEITTDVFFTQKDVRQFQLAKSAVYSALATLMKLENITFNDIESLYISGGFSQELNIDNAILTGLLPEEFKSKIITLNNTSLEGTIRYSLNEENPLNRFESIKHIDLSLNDEFSESFINNMEFLNGGNYEE